MQDNILQKNLKDKLEEKKLSIAELERRAGLRHAVINILHGRSKNPSIRVAQAIAKELGCSVEDLLTVNPLTSENETATETTMTSGNNHQQLFAKPAAYEKPKQIWDPILAAKALEIFNNYLTVNATVVDTSSVFLCLREIYEYTYAHPNKQVDPQFVNWIAQKMLIPDNKTK